jgi:hypothetical protein
MSRESLSCLNQGERNCCTCPFPPGSLIHVGDDVTFLPKSRLCRVGSVLFHSSSFSFGFHIWSHLTGVSMDRPKNVTLERCTCTDSAELSYYLNVSYSVESLDDNHDIPSSEPATGLHHAILISDILRRSYNRVLASTYVRRIQRLMRRHLATRRMAFIMALNARLGQKSPVHVLCDDVLHRILIH